MSEEQNKEALSIRKEKSDTSEKNINNQQENNNEINPITIEVKKTNKEIEVYNNNEIQNTDDRINEKLPQEILPIQLDEKDIYLLPPEIIEKLNLPPCQICQTSIFSVYIPEIVAPPNNSNNENPEPITNNNAELQTIKSPKKQTYTLPILICQQKHQFCLLCHQNVHLDSFCKDEHLNNDNLDSMFDIIKEVIPEEKKIVLDSIKNHNLSETKKGGCSCACFWYTTLYIFILFLWTIASFFLFTFGLGVLFYTCALRIGCCLFHCFRYTFCTTYVTDEDKGDYILRTTTVDVGRQKEIKAEAAESDDCLAKCGPFVLSISIYLIPKGFSKISELYEDWREKF